jgi:hypothetical protein
MIHLLWPNYDTATKYANNRRSQNSPERNPMTEYHNNKMKNEFSDDI